MGVMVNGEEKELTVAEFFDYMIFEECYYVLKDNDTDRVIYEGWFSEYWQYVSNYEEFTFYDAIDSTRKTLNDFTLLGFGISGRDSDDDEKVKLEIFAVPK